MLVKVYLRFLVIQNPYIMYYKMTQKVHFNCKKKGTVISFHFSGNPSEPTFNCDLSAFKNKC